VEASANARRTRRFGQLYDRLVKKHGNKTARVAVAREMLRVIYYILTKGEEFRDKEQKSHNQQSQGNQY